MRYRKLGDNFWGDEKVLTLTPEERYVALYCLTGQSNQIGCFPFSLALAAEDTGLDLQIFRERFLNVCRVLSWGYDLQCRVLYIPTWWKYNQPQNANNLKGNLKDLPVLPHSPLVTQFCNNLQHLNPDLHETFTQTLRERYPQRMATQEQSIAEHSRTVTEREQKDAPAAPSLASVSVNGDTWPSIALLVRDYNASRPKECPEAKHLSSADQEKARAALRAYPDRSFWQDVFLRLSGSPFLRGNTPGQDGRCWTADLPWLLSTGKDQVENYLKVTGGKYRNRRQTVSEPVSRPATEWKPYDDSDLYLDDISEKEE